MGDIMLTKYFFSGAMALGLFFSSAGQADIINFPGDKLKKPIQLCKESPDPELSGEALHLLGQASQDVECGQYKKALNKLYHAVEIVEHLQQQAGAAKGYCYYDRRCKSLVSSQKTTKRKCKQLAGGKSWRQVDPTPASCVSI